MKYGRCNSVPNSKACQRMLIQRSMSMAMKPTTMDAQEQKEIIRMLIDVKAHLRAFIKLFQTEWNLVLPPGVHPPSEIQLTALPQLKPLFTGSLDEVSSLTLMQRWLTAMSRDVPRFLDPAHAQAALHDHNQVLDLLARAETGVSDAINYINNHGASVGQASSCASSPSECALPASSCTSSPSGCTLSASSCASSPPGCSAAVSLTATFHFSRALQILAAAMVLERYLDTYS